jgi:PAS domain S-box-containing protein
MRIQNALAESEARFRNMADNAPVMMWVTDREGRCTYLNTRWCDFTGQDPAAALGHGWGEAVHPADRPRVAAELVAANAAQQQFRVEYRLRRADGVYRWVIDAAAPRLADNGDYLGYIGSVIDIDARHESEARLQASEGRFRAAVGALQGVLWTNNARGEMVGDQPGWAALTGQSAADYTGFGWTAAVHPDDIAGTLTAWQRAVATGSIFSHEHRVRRHDGLWCNFAVRAVPILDAAGEVVEWVGIHTDITEQRTAEAALLTLNLDLEHRIATEVAERVRVEEALRQSQKMDALGQLTGGIAHDFNNMLSVITSSFSLLQRRLVDPDDTTLRYIEAGHDAATRAAGLTRRMLAFARQQPLAPETIDIAALIAGLEQLLRHSLGAAMALECRIEPGLWPTLADRNQLENAILNLAVNARDAMGDNGRLLIEARNVAAGSDGLPDDIPPGDYIALGITDNGTGMTDEVRDKVFEPFFTTKPPGQGTGLGLSQVYGFVRQSGGSIAIVSAPGQGTRVELHLPRVDPEPA